MLETRSAATKQYLLGISFGFIIFLVIYMQFLNHSYHDYDDTSSSLDVPDIRGNTLNSDEVLPAFHQVESNLWLNMESYSRLGNNLYEYAALLGLATRNGRYAFIALGTFTEMLEVFALTLSVHDVPYLNWTRVWDPMVSHTWTYNMTNHLPPVNITLGGSFQSFIYFQDIKQQIRKELTFRTNIQNQATRYLARIAPEKWRGDEFVQVGVHIRHTDLLDEEYAKHGFFFPDVSYFINAMKYFTDRFEKVQFIIASDDLDFCKKFFVNFTEEITFSEHHSPGLDMAILVTCDHVIVTIGTYGWWVGWLNHGTTVYMEDFPANGTWAAGIYRNGQYIPFNDDYNHWVGVRQDVPPNI